MAKILVVEDEPDISDVVQVKLTQLGHVVEVAPTGIDAIAFIDAYTFDLLILDRNIPPPDGLEVLRYARSKRSGARVLMLTSKSEVTDKLAAFDIGADDYLTKPFDLRELVARVNALVSRPEQRIAATLTVGDLVLDSSNSSVSKNGQPLHLQPKDFALLEFLMRHPEETFSAEALLGRVWHSDSNASVEGLRMAISRIRKCVDDPGSSRSVIENIPKVGYKLRNSVTRNADG